MKGWTIDLEDFRQFLSGKLKESSRDHVCGNANTLISGRGGKIKTCPEDPLHPHPVDLSEDFDKLYQEAVDHRNKHRYQDSHFSSAIKWLQQYQSFFFHSQVNSYNSSTAFVAKAMSNGRAHHDGHSGEALTTRKRPAKKSLKKIRVSSDGRGRPARIRVPGRPLHAAAQCARACKSA